MKEKSDCQSESFEELYKRYYPKLTSFASLFLKSEEEAHDVVQDLFLSLLETDYTDIEALNAYLYRSIRNKCVDSLRREMLQNQYNSELGEKLLQKESEYFYATQNEIENALISKEFQEKVEAVVNELPPKGKEIFKLYFFDQKTAKEISLILNISISTVENHIYNNLKVVRQKMSKYLLLFLLIMPL